jgi:hypothetical protein
MTIGPRDVCLQHTALGAQAQAMENMGTSTPSNGDGDGDGAGCGSAYDASAKETEDFLSSLL